jgi:hypothetical protein
VIAIIVLGAFFGERRRQLMNHRDRAR